MILWFLAGVCYSYSEIQHIWGFNIGGWMYNSKGDRVNYFLRNWILNNIKLYQWLAGRQGKTQKQSNWERFTLSIFSNAYHFFRKAEQVLLVLPFLIFDVELWTIPIAVLLWWLGRKVGLYTIIEEVK